MNGENIKTLREKLAALDRLLRDHEPGLLAWRIMYQDRMTELAEFMPHRPPVPELEGTFQVVLYFANDADRQEFVDIVKLVKPNLVAKSLQ